MVFIKNRQNIICLLLGIFPGPLVLLALANIFQLIYNKKKLGNNIPVKQ